MRFPTSADKSLHGSFFPSDVYPGEDVFAVVRKISQSDLSIPLRLRVWRLSPLGVELLSEASPSETIQNGCAVSFSLHMGASSVDMDGTVVEIESDPNGSQLLAIRFVSQSVEPVTRNEERRQSRRWICHDMYLPTCVWKHPARFNEFVFGRIRDVSAGGARIVTSLRNKFLVRGMEASMTFNFPLIGQFQTSAIISNLAVTTELGKDYLSIGVEFPHLTAMDKEVIAQYLNQFGQGATPSQLIRSGLVPSSISDSVSYSFVRTEEEFSEVLELRRSGYVASKKVPPNTSAKEMGTSYDARSRIIIGRYQGKVIATAALVFHEYHDRMEIEEDVEWPQEFPRKENCVEVIRLCTHASFRGTDVVMSLFNFVGLTVAQSGRPFIVFGATDGLLPLYKRMGAEPTKLVYEHRHLNSTKHTVVIVDVAAVITGRTSGPVAWNVVWRDVNRFLVDHGVLKLNRKDRIRVFIYQLLGFFSYTVRRRRKRPRAIDSAASG